MLHTFSNENWESHYPDSMQQDAIKSIEQGRILHFPTLAFALSETEKSFLTPTYADPKSKNISFHPQTKKLWGIQNLTDAQHIQLKEMLERYANSAIGLIKNLLPRYAAHMSVGRTSFRPVQVSDRATSYRKDDRRLHVDAFPSAPNQGKRILRVFTNVNPHGEDRIWRIGESFDEVAARFLPQIKKPLPGSATLLRAFKITKSYRTMYDHYMLQLHDMMKGDEEYQKSARQQEIRFSPGSSWIVQTDHVSHAAMKGQYVMEQTFYLPVNAMQDESLSPLRTLERMLQQRLV